LFNPYTPQQLGNILNELKVLLEIIEGKDVERMQQFLEQVRKNIE